MPAKGEIVQLDAQAVGASVEVVSRVSRADLGRPTPCDGWTLADLLAHMTVQHIGFAAAAAGNGADLARWHTGAPADDPVPGIRRGGRGGPGRIRPAGRPGPGVRAAGAQRGPDVPGAAGHRVPLRGLRGARLGRRQDTRPGLRSRARPARRGARHHPGRPRRGEPGDGPAPPSRRGWPSPAAARSMRSSPCSAAAPAGQADRPAGHARTGSRLPAPAAMATVGR